MAETSMIRGIAGAHTKLVVQKCRGKSFSSSTVQGTLPVGGMGVQIDHFASVQRVFTQEDVSAYARLVGDMNPLHQPMHQKSSIDPIVQKSNFVRWNDDGTNRPLVHGMLVASLFTCIFGTRIPGAVYMRQNLEFRRPVFVGDVVVGRVTVTSLQPWKKGGLVLTCATQVLFDDNKECIRGEAQVLLTKDALVESKQ